MKKIILVLGFVGLLSTNVFGMKMEIEQELLGDFALTELKNKHPKIYERMTFFYTGDNNSYGQFIQRLNMIKIECVSGVDIKIKEFINKPFGENGENLLHWAIRDGLPEVVKKLIKLGADVNCRCFCENLHKLSPLHLAARGFFRCNGEIIKILLENGADPSVLTERSITVVQKISFLETLCHICILSKDVILFLEDLLTKHPNFLSIKDGDGNNLEAFIASLHSNWLGYRNQKFWKNLDGFEDWYVENIENSNKKIDTYLENLNKLREWVRGFKV